MAFAIALPLFQSWAEMIIQYCLYVFHHYNTQTYLEMSQVTRTSVFGVCDQLRLKPACSATETS